MRNLLRILLLFITSATFAGCGGPGNDYSEYRNLPADGWRYGDTLRFLPSHPDSVAAGRLAIGVRHSNDFRYKTLWLEVTTENPAGKRRVDTLAIHLADDFGRWRSQGLGASFQLADTIPSPITHRSGSPVKVRHIMRADTLPGITQLGIFFMSPP